MRKKMNFILDMTHDVKGQRFSEKFNIVKYLYQTNLSEIVMVHDNDENPYILKVIDHRLYGKLDLDMLQNIKDVGVVPILETFRTQAYDYILKPFLDGQTFDDYIKQASDHEKHDVYLSLCQTVKHLHENYDHPVIIRDIKPENIIMVAKQPVIIDLESYRLMKQESKQDTILMGTPGFASPEQFGARATDERTDIYALGKLLFYILTGSYHDDNTILKETLSPHQYKKYGRVITKATQFDPDQRYKSVQDFIDSLNRKPTSNAFKVSSIVMVTLIVLAGVNTFIPFLDEKMSSLTITQDILNEDEVKIENMIGDDYSSHLILLKTKEIALEIKEEQYSEVIEKGVIISQSLKSGTIITKGDAVSVVISKGSQWLLIPDFTGLDMSEVDDLARKDQMTYKILYEYSNEHLEGHVMDVLPRGGQQKEGESITLVIAKNFNSTIYAMSEKNKLLHIEVLDFEPDQSIQIRPWLIENFDSISGGFTTLVDLNNLPENLQDINQIRVRSGIYAELKKFNELISDTSGLDNFHDVQDGWGRYNSGGTYYNNHTILLATDGVVKAYAFVTDELVDISSLPKEISKKPLSDVSYSKQYAINDMSLHTVVEGSKISAETTININDQQRELVFGIKQIPDYNNNGFLTQVNRNDLPDSLKNCNQISVYSTPLQSTIGTMVYKTYQDIYGNNMSGIRSFDRSSDLIFDSTGSYYHSQIVFLYEDFVIKAAIKVDVDGTISYQYIN